MNLYRFEQLKRAQALLDLSERLAQSGDHYTAAGKVFEARAILFGKPTHPASQEPESAENHFARNPQ